MAKKAVEFKVGIVVIFGIIMLVASVLWLRGYQYRTGTYDVKVRFDDVGGLKSGDRVMVAGVIKGKVKDVDLVSEGVEVTLNLAGDTHLSDDAGFRIKNYGLMGERYVSISQGKSAQKIDFEQVYYGVSDAGTAELMGLLGEMVKDVQEMIEIFKRTVASEKSLTDFSHLIASIGKLSDRLNSFMYTNESLINSTVENVENISGKLISFVDTAQTEVTHTLDNFSQASEKLNALTDSLTVIASSLSEFLTDVEEGRGTLGLLGTDETLYQDVKKMLRSVETIIDDIRRDPERYLNIELKIF